MVFAAPLLMLAYIGFLCLSFFIGAILPVMTVIMAVVNLAVLTALLILWHRLKKKGWFSKENHDRLLTQEGGYWKVTGMKAVRLVLIIGMILSAVCLLLFSVLAGVLYL